MREKRPRLTVPQREPVVADELMFLQNKCTIKARKIVTTIEGIEIDLWFDKHYYDRYQFGDDNGMRVGIGTDIVEALVLKSLKHLMLYSCYVKNFTFLNIEPELGRALRVVLQRSLGECKLHVVIEAHFLRIDRYEITVKTAMCTDDFKMSDGQYSLEIDGNNSTLYKMDSKSLLEIYHL